MIGARAAVNPTRLGAISTLRIDVKSSYIISGF
jgi:hypothetical protein